MHTTAEPELVTKSAWKTIRISHRARAVRLTLRLSTIHNKANLIKRLMQGRGLVLGGLSTIMQKKTNLIKRLM